MSKRAYISRYLLVIKKLKSKPWSTYEELQQYIENKLEYLQMLDEELNIGFSKRTLQRDLREIRNIFGIDIEYSKANKGYFISQTERESMNFQRMMEAFDIFNSLNLAQDLSPFIHLEQRQPQGTDNLYGLLHAIKNHLQIQFTYRKFWEDEITERTVEPFALKEFKNRWYVYGKDCNDENFKTFALDRLSELTITKQKFHYPVGFDAADSFRYCFGIINPKEEAPQNIVLSFKAFQGKYIKTLPLHHTQQTLIDNDEKLHVQLRLCITHDFIMELLSFGENVKVLKPKALVETIKAAHHNALNSYMLP